MSPEIYSAIQACEWYPSSFLIFSDNVFVPLIYYSHFGALIPTLAIGLFVLQSNRKNLSNQLLFLTCFTFGIWIFGNLVLWATEKPQLTMVFWSFLIVIEPIIYFLAFYFAYTFIFKKDLSFLALVISTLPLFPSILLAPTDLGLIGYDLTNCDRAATEGVLAVYGYFIEILYVITIITIGLLAVARNKPTRAERQSILFLIVGLVLFLLSFSLGNIVEVFTENWYIGLYGLFGAPIFASFIAYIIIRFGAFNSKLIAAQALIAALWILVFTLLFVKDLTKQWIVTLTLILISVIGFALVKSVKKEIQQRELLEKLTKQLEAANNRLEELDKLKSEFVSIASHQLRSPLTSMRGYASMLMDGSYGTIPEKAKEAVSRIADSSLFMAKMVENYLNVSRIESGNMKYELSDFNLKLEVEKLIDDKRQEAMKKGLLLTFKSQLGSQAIVHADIGKTLEIVHNLLNNALKYTPKGSIDVLVRDDQKKKKIYVDIKDSGIGISKEDAEKLFGKFQRATNANSVNTTGTGLGLYVARTMALAMKGEITAYSVGPGTGSTFTFELPLMM